MLAVLEAALASGNRYHADRLTGQGSIFDLDGVLALTRTNGQHRPRVSQHPTVPDAEFERRELLGLEKEALGLYVSEHPLERARGTSPAGHRLPRSQTSRASSRRGGRLYRRDGRRRFALAHHA